MTIGNSSRDPKPTDPGGLVFNKIAQDAICVVTNTDNPVAGPRPGADPGDLLAAASATGARSRARPRRGPIDLIVRTAASGTQDAFQKIFMGTTPVLRRAPARRHPTASSQQAVQSDPNAIGYVSLAFTNGVNAVPYKGVACNLRNAKSGQYGGVRNFCMVTRGAPTGAAAEVHQLDHSTARRRARSSPRSGCRSS